MQINPALQSLHLKLGRSITSQFLWSYVTKYTGQGIEFADIRQYVQGDDIKRIDWKTSAKKGEWYSKKYVEERQLRVWFVKWSLLSRSVALKNKRDELIYALWYAALKNGDRIWSIQDDRWSVHVEKMSGKWEAVRRMLSDNSWSDQRTDMSTDTAISTVAKKRWDLFSYILRWPNAQKNEKKPLSLNELLAVMVRLRIKGSLLVIPCFDLQVDHALIKKLWHENEILFVHLFHKAERTGHDEFPYLQFWTGSKSVWIWTWPGAQKERDAYIRHVNELLETTKRTVQSVGGTYLLLDETSDVVREIMLKMR